MNAIKHATKPKIETTFEALKIISQQEKCQAHRSKTHTHTHTHKTSLTNFLFQKQVKTV